MIRIAKSDWDRVHDLACDVVNASSAEDSVLRDSKNEALLCLLHELEEKYGPCSRITATIADFTDERGERPQLYQKALRQAQSEGDAKEEKLILESIAEMAEDEKAVRVVVRIGGRGI